MTACMHCGASDEDVKFRSKNVCMDCFKEISRDAHHDWYVRRKDAREAYYAADPLLPWVVVPERVFCDYCAYYLQCQETVLKSGGNVLCKPVRVSDMEMARAYQIIQEARSE